MKVNYIFSYIVPVYNCERYLKKCVESIIEQIEKSSAEIILVDDGSLDKSGLIGDQLAQLNENVFCYHKVNGGAASARNYGILKSTGRYIVFVDGDDTLDLQFRDIIPKVISSNPETLFIYGMSFDFYKDDIFIRGENFSSINKGTISITELLHNYQIYFQSNALSSACNKIFRGDIIREKGILFNEGMTLYEDYEFVLQYLRYIEWVEFIDMPLYHYRHNLGKGRSQSRLKNLKSLSINGNYLLSTMFNIWQELGNTELFMLNSGANLYMQLLSQHLIVGRDKIAEEKKQIQDYCNQSIFRNFLINGATLEEDSKKLLQDVDNGRFYVISCKYLYRKKQRVLKKRIKAIFAGIQFKK